MKALVVSRISLVALCCLAAACSNRGPTHDLSGYRHTFGHSRFDTGSVTSEVEEYGMHKVVGDVGTFATQLVSGGAIAIPNVPFPNPAFGVYSGDADDQNGAVRSYFVSAGLPEEQVASVTADGTVYLHGDYQLSGWFSSLNRGYEGVPIDNSIAFAAFDASGRSSEEQVYWPEISADVLEQVHAFQDMLADPGQKSVFVQKLPASSREAILVIRHTSWFWQGDFAAVACCRGASLVGACFDMTGRPVHLPDDEEQTP